MPCQLRSADLIDPLPSKPVRTRMERLQNLICTGPWNTDDTICLIYWKPAPNGGGKWVAWQDNPPPNVDPLPQAGVTVP